MIPTVLFLGIIAGSLLLGAQVGLQRWPAETDSESVIGRQPSNNCVDMGDQVGVRWRMRITLRKGVNHFPGIAKDAAWPQQNHINEVL